MQRDPSVSADVLTAELHAYRQLVDAAMSAADDSRRALHAIAASTGEQNAAIAQAAGAVEDARDGAAGLARSAGMLREHALRAVDAAGAAAGGVSGMDASLARLGSVLASGRTPLAGLESAAGSLKAFVRSLHKLSSKAQVLSVTAAVEAANVGDGEGRFAIVAAEVRRLSESTATSASSVTSIVGGLERACADVAEALDRGETAKGAAADETRAADAALGTARAGLAGLDELTLSLAAISEEQSAAMDEVANAVSEIARHATAAAAAAQAASRFDLTALLAPASAAVDAWRPEEADASARAILAALTTAAKAVARNTFSWKGIAASLDAVRVEIATARGAVDEAASGARGAAATAHDMRTVVDAAELAYAASLAALVRALDVIGAIERSVKDVDTVVGGMNAASERAAASVGMIDDVSAETTLLSLNAAIESARAGERGRGFSVIAREIRALAAQTQHAAGDVRAAIAGIASGAETMRGALGSAAGASLAVAHDAQRVRDAFDEMRSSLAGTVEQAIAVAATSEEQARALASVLQIVTASAETIDGDAALATDARRVEIVLLASKGHEIAACRSIGLQTERVRELVSGLAADIEAVFERAITRGRLSERTAFDFTYTPVTGSRIAPLGRLFDVRLVPATGFVPAKYETPWDAAVDEEITDLLESARREGTFCGAFAVVAGDINSFVYAFSRPQTADWTGDAATDLANNRVKRLNEDEVLLRNARLGMGPAAERLGIRLPYHAFEHAGCILDRPQERPWRAFVYARDTGEVFNEVTMALYVRGRRHGNVRLVYGADVL